MEQLRQYLIPVCKQTSNKSVGAHLRCRHEILSADGSETVGRQHKVERRNGETVRLESDGLRSKVADRTRIEQFSRNEVVAELLLGEFEKWSEFVKEGNLPFDLAHNIGYEAP